MIFLEPLRKIANELIKYDAKIWEQARIKGSGNVGVTYKGLKRGLPEDVFQDRYVPKVSEAASKKRANLEKKFAELLEKLAEKLPESLPTAKKPLLSLGHRTKPPGNDNRWITKNFENVMNELVKWQEAFDKNQNPNPQELMQKLLALAENIKEEKALREAAR